MRSTSALVLVGALMLAGCADNAEEAIEEADPGLEVTIEPPAAEEPEVVDDEAATDDEALVPEGTSAECFEAVSAAGDGTEVEGLAEDTEPLWPAFDACASVEEFGAATDSVSGILGDEDPETYLSDLCSRIPEVEDSVLCLEIAG